MDPTSVLVGVAVGLVIGVIGMIVIGSKGQPGATVIGGPDRLQAVTRRAAQDADYAAKLKALVEAADKPPEPVKPVKPSGAPLRMLALLQAEARLVDFLMEDISGAGDAQIGQAVREIHKKGQQALKQHAVIEQVLTGNEGDKTTVPKGFDPSAVRVVGNVTGEPPFTGAINHPGWRVKELKLAAPPEGADEFVLQPAEVQIG